MQLSLATFLKTLYNIPPLMLWTEEFRRNFKIVLHGTKSIILSFCMRRRYSI